MEGLRWEVWPRSPCSQSRLGQNRKWLASVAWNPGRAERTQSFLCSIPLNEPQSDIQFKCLQPQEQPQIAVTHPALSPCSYLCNPFPFLLSYTVVAKPNTNIDLTNGLTFAYCAPLRKSTYVTQVTSCGVFTAQLTVTCNLVIHSRYTFGSLYTHVHKHTFTWSFVSKLQWGLDSPTQLCEDGQGSP